MKYQLYNLGFVEEGEIVEVTSEHNNANIFLVDVDDYEKLKKGFDFNYTGGKMNVSPFLLQVPKSKYWYIVVNPYKNSRKTKRKVQVLHEMRRTSLKSLSDLIYKDNYMHKSCDIFVSYDKGDMDDTIQLFIDSLKEKGLNVSSGDIGHINEKKNVRLTDTKLGIVFLSKNYMQNHKNNLEVKPIHLNQDIHENVILPIWHRTSKNEMLELKDVLENNISRNTFSYDIEDIACEIVEAIQ